MNWLTSRGLPLVTLSALALAGCDKGTDLNVDLPNTSVVSTEYTDLSVDAATVQIVPVQSQKTDHYLAGRLTDNIAGSIEAKAYLNLITGTSNDSLPVKMAVGAIPVLDSVVLIAGFDKVNGTTTAPVRLDVFNLPAPLDERLAYSSNTVIPTPMSLGQNLPSRLDRTLRIKTPATPTAPEYTTTVADQTVRLVMQRGVAVTAPYAPAPAIASPFFSNTFFGPLKTATSFNQAQLDGLLNGLAIAPSTGYSGSIVHFTRGYNGRLVFYFHDDNIPAPTPPLTRKWHSYSFYFGPLFSTSGAAAARDPRYFTYIDNNFAGTELSLLADRTQAVASNQLSGKSYLQEGVGIGTRVTFRGVDALRATPGITINRAELYVPVKPFSNVLFPNPNQVFALEVDATNHILQRTINYLPTDRVVQADGANPLGTGSPAFTTLQNATSTQPYYTLLLTSYLQAYLTDKLEGNPASLVIVPTIRSSASLTLNRATVDAASIRLRVYYSKR